MDALVLALQNALGNWYMVLVYGIGILAMCFSVSSVQFKKRVAILTCSCVGQICWIAYFLVQGDLTSAVACVLTAIMLAVFTKKNKWKWATSTPIVIFFVVIMTGFSLLSFATWKDIFPLVAGVFAVIANSRPTEKRLRQFALGWYIFWVMNGIFKFYPVALINDVMCTCSAVIALIRYRNKQEKQEINQ